MTYNKAYYEANRERIGKRMKIYRVENNAKLKSYFAAYRATHKQRIADYGKAWKARDPDHVRELGRNAAKEYTRRMKEEIYKQLGGKCTQCGISDQRVLQINHINGGGAKERMHNRSNTWFYRNILKTGRRDIEILCANCNLIHAHENRLIFHLAVRA